MKRDEYTDMQGHTLPCKNGRQTHGDDKTSDIYKESTHSTQDMLRMTQLIVLDNSRTEDTDETRWITHKKGVRAWTVVELVETRSARND